MPVVSADSLQLAHIKEVTPGVTPATPAFKLWRTTGESLTFSPNVSESGELGGNSRSRKPGNVTGSTVSGDINFELSKFPALEEAIAGVLAAEWGECPLTGAPGGVIEDTNRITVGDGLDTYTIEKRFSNPGATPGAMDFAASPGVLGATVDITITGTTAVGSGVVEVTLAQDNGDDVDFSSAIAPGDTPTDAATTLAAVIDADPNWGATSAAGIVTATPTGTAVTKAEASAGPDLYYYQRYVGASYSVLNIATAPNEPVTGSVSVVGGTPVLSNIPITGATYASAGSSPVFTAPEVLALNMGPSLGVLTACWSSLTINLDSQNRGIPCIGGQGDREVVTGLLAATVSGDVYFTSQDPLEALLSNEVIGDGNVTLSNADSEIYRFDFFDVKITAGELTAGGTGQDLTMPLEFQPTPVKVCDDGAGNDWEASLTICLQDTAPVLP